MVIEPVWVTFVFSQETLAKLKQGKMNDRNVVLMFHNLSYFRSSGPVSFGYSELENNNQGQASIISADMGAQTTPGIERAPFSIKNELKVYFDQN